MRLGQGEMQESIILRPACPDDEAFLFDLFCSVHEQTFALLDIPEEKENDLLHMQFTAQQQQYRGWGSGIVLHLIVCPGMPDPLAEGCCGAAPACLGEVRGDHRHRGSSMDVRPYDGAPREERDLHGLEIAPRDPLVPQE